MTPKEKVVKVIQDYLDKSGYASFVPEGYVEELADEILAALGLDA